MTPPRSPDDPGSGLGAGQSNGAGDGGLGSVGHDVATLEALLAGDPAAVTDGELADAVVALQVLADRVAATQARWLGTFGARMVWAGDGARSAAGWLTARTEVSRAQAHGLMRTAVDLRACPHVEAAYRSGKLGTAKVRLLLRARPTHPSLFAEHEAELVQTIVPLTVAHATVAIARWEAMALAFKEYEEGEGDGVDDPPVDPAADNSLSMSRTLDGRYAMDVDLDAISGSELERAIAARVDAQFRNGTYHADDGLTAKRRACDALVELALRGANPNTTKHGDPRPSVSITIDHRTLAGIAPEDLLDALSRTCELDDGTPIPRAAAERLLCTARVMPMLTQIDANGQVETLGVTEHLRDATRRQRRALKARDGGCAFPGCDAPVDWCDAHHLVPFEAGGPTLIRNLVLLCRFHHHLVHEGGWRLERTSAGTLRLHRPDGTEMACTHHGHKVKGGGAAQPRSDRPPDPPPHYAPPT